MSRHRRTRGEVGAARWLDASQLIVTTDPDGDYLSELEHEGPPVSGIRDVVAGWRWMSRSSAWNPRALAHPCAGGVLYVEQGHPHWWAPGRGAPLVWRDITVVASPDIVKRGRNRPRLPVAGSASD